MCLDLYGDNTLKVAEEDIICYKFLKRVSKNNFTSPYQHFKYDLGVEYSAEFTVFDKEHLTVTYDSSGKPSSTFELNYQVEEGLHSAKKLDEIREYVDLFNFTYTGDYVIVECIIPKGASYYEGYWYGKDGYYASNKLVATKVIK